MKYANIMTLNELLEFNKLSDFIVVEEGSNKEIKNYDLKEYRVNYISSTSKMVPSGVNAYYESESEHKPDIYKRPNLLVDKSYIIQTYVVIYVSKITNEVLKNDK